MTGEKYIVVFVEKPEQIPAVRSYFHLIPDIHVDILVHADEMPMSEGRAIDLILIFSYDNASRPMKRLKQFRLDKTGDNIPVVVLRELPPPAQLFDLLAAGRGEK